MSKIISLVDPNNSSEAMYPQTVANAVWYSEDPTNPNAAQRSLQSLITTIQDYNGGSTSSGSSVTAPAGGVTLSTTSTNYITVDGTSYGIKLPTSDPYVSQRIPSSHDHGSLSNNGILYGEDEIQSGDFVVYCKSGGELAKSSIQFDGNDAKYLSGAGTWEEVPSGGTSLPTQSGNSGKFLTTNGTTLSWASVSGGGSVTLPTGNITLSTTPQLYITANGTSRSISLPSTDPYTTARTPDTHSHGYIANDGTCLSTVAKDNGDSIIISDATDSNKIVRSDITFGSNTNQYLSNAGTWEYVPSGGSGGIGACRTYASGTVRPMLEIYMYNFSQSDEYVQRINFSSMSPSPNFCNISNLSGAYLIPIVTIYREDTDESIPFLAVTQEVAELLKTIIKETVPMKDEK